MKRSVAGIAGPLACETAQKAKRFELTAYFGGQPTLELMIAKSLEARTSDFIEPLHGNYCIPVEFCCVGHRQSSSNAITSCVGDA